MSDLPSSGAVREALAYPISEADVLAIPKEVFLALADAARDWLRIQEEAETIWWCEEHELPGGRDDCLWDELPGDVPSGPCRMVECLVVPLGDNE